MIAGEAGCAGAGREEWHGSVALVSTSSMVRMVWSQVEAVVKLHSYCSAKSLHDDDATHSAIIHSSASMLYETIYFLLGLTY